MPTHVKARTIARQQPTLSLFLSFRFFRENPIIPTATWSSRTDQQELIHFNERAAQMAPPTQLGVGQNLLFSKLRKKTYIETKSE